MADCLAVKGCHGLMNQAQAVRCAAKPCQLAVQFRGFLRPPSAALQSGKMHRQLVQLMVLRSVQDVGIAGGCQGEAVVEIGEREGSLGRVVIELQLAIFQHLRVIATEKGGQHAAVQQGILDSPVDIEVSGIGARYSPFQYAAPPGVGVADGHVVGYDIENQTHAFCPQGSYQPLQGCLTAELRVDPGRVDHIVTVHGAGPGPCQG